MPRHLTLAIPALATLAEQLRFAPVAAARRHVERAEALMAIVDRAESYPEDFISFKITGFRPEITSPALIPGEELRRELPALIDRLCRGAKYTPSDLPPPQWLNTAELARKWNVSRRTIERARREGLSGRRVNLGGGRVEPASEPLPRGEGQGWGLLLRPRANVSRSTSAPRSFATPPPTPSLSAPRSRQPAARLPRSTTAPPTPSAASS